MFSAFKQAMQWYKLEELARSGDADAQIKLGDLLLEEKRNAGAINWYEKAVAQGEMVAKIKLLKAYLIGANEAELNQTFFEIINASNFQNDFCHALRQNLLSSELVQLIKWINFSEFHISHEHLQKMIAFWKQIDVGKLSPEEAVMLRTNILAHIQNFDAENLWDREGMEEVTQAIAYDLLLLYNQLFSSPDFIASSFPEALRDKIIARAWPKIDKQVEAVKQLCEARRDDAARQAQYVNLMQEISELAYYHERAAYMACLDTVAPCWPSTSVGGERRKACLQKLMAQFPQLIDALHAEEVLRDSISIRARYLLLKLESIDGQKEELCDFFREEQVDRFTRESSHEIFIAILKSDKRVVLKFIQGGFLFLNSLLNQMGMLQGYVDVTNSWEQRSLLRNRSERRGEAPRFMMTIAQLFKWHPEVLDYLLELPSADYLTSRSLTMGILEKLESNHVEEGEARCLVSRLPDIKIINRVNVSTDPKSTPRYIRLCLRYPGLAHLLIAKLFIDSPILVDEIIDAPTDPNDLTQFTADVRHFFAVFTGELLHKIVPYITNLADWVFNVIDEIAIKVAAPLIEREDLLYLATTSWSIANIALHRIPNPTPEEKSDILCRVSLVMLTEREKRHFYQLASTLPSAPCVFRVVQAHLEITYGILQYIRTHLDSCAHIDMTTQMKIALCEERATAYFLNEIAKQRIPLTAFSTPEDMSGEKTLVTWLLEAADKYHDLAYFCGLELLARGYLNAAFEAFRLTPVECGSNYKKAMRHCGSHLLHECEQMSSLENPDEYAISAKVVEAKNYFELAVNALPDDETYQQSISTIFSQRTYGVEGLANRTVDRIISTALNIVKPADESQLARPSTSAQLVL